MKDDISVKFPPADLIQMNRNNLNNSAKITVARSNNCDHTIIHTELFLCGSIKGICI